MKYVLTIIAGISLLSACTGQTPAKPESHAPMVMADMPQQMAMMNQMVPKYLGPRGPEFDKRFIDMMIPHHEGAIIAARQVLAESDRPELKQMAEKMINTQEAEIEQLKQWRELWYGK